MPSSPNCLTAPFFVLRTPSLPIEVLPNLSQHGQDLNGGQVQGQNSGKDYDERLDHALAEWIGRPEVREALELASPDLMPLLAPWREGLLPEREAKRIRNTLVKYLNRMSHRATPFGLFAAVSIGRWSDRSSLSIPPFRACRRTLRVDWAVLQSLVGQVESVPSIRPSLRYRPNESLFRTGRGIRYTTQMANQKDGSPYGLEEADPTPHLDSAIRLSTGGITSDSLASELASERGVEPVTAAEFVNRLIDSQVLVGTLGPALTEGNPLDQIQHQLKECDESTRQVERIRSISEELKALESLPIGSGQLGYQNLRFTLGRADATPSHGHTLHGDLFRPCKDLALPQRVASALASAAETLRLLTPTRTDGPLERFRSAFENRYSTRWVSLLEALDEETGIGFEGNEHFEGPLLESLPFERPGPSKPFTPRDAALLARMPKWLGGQVWEFDEDDLAALSALNPEPFPASFASLVSISATDAQALDRGDFTFWMEQYSGPTAARWLGRFALGDPELCVSLKAELEEEESQQPEAVFAEVLHVPDGKTGNVLVRPKLRKHEIPFLSQPGVPNDQVIWPADLWITVRGGRIFLYSERLGKQVIPRLSSAHNFRRGPAVYRFLAHLQDQDGAPGGWSWGVLSNQPFLPRVTRGPHVISKARWRIEARELKLALGASGAGAWEAFQILRKQKSLPRFVVLTDADNTLFIDMDELYLVEMLYSLVSGRSSFLLTECFPTPANALAESPDGHHTHELVVPFRSKRPRPAAIPAFGLEKSPAVQWAYPPGSEWLYLKIYCSPDSADRLLKEWSSFLLKEQGDRLWDRWHYIRYRDPEHHLRIRFHGNPGGLTSTLFPQFGSLLDDLLACGLVQRWQVDTFHPEIDRYGGQAGFPHCDEWFHQDSLWVLSLLGEETDPNERWKAGMQRVDEIWGSLGLDIPARLELADSIRQSLRKEFANSQELAIRMGDLFRTVRGETMRWFRPTPSPCQGPTSHQPLGALLLAIEEGEATGDPRQIASSLSHMHLNRLFRTDQREQEWVLMEFLVRIYQSIKAREAGSSTVRRA